MKKNIILALSACALVMLAGCAVMSDLAKELGFVPTTRSEIRVVGVPDDQWAKQNDLSADELSTFQDLRRAWIPLVIKHYSSLPPCTIRSFQEFCLTTNRLAVPDTVSGPAYYIELPEDAVEKVVARSHPFHSGTAICLLAEEGLYFSQRKQDLEKDNQIPVYFVYYTALGLRSDEIVEQIETASNLGSGYWGGNGLENKTPWDIPQLKKVAHNRTVKDRLANLESLRETPDFSFEDFKELYELTTNRDDRAGLLGETLVWLGMHQRLSSSSVQTNFTAQDLMFFLEALEPYRWQLKGNTDAEKHLASVTLMAAEKGSAEAQFLYGKALIAGEGVKKDKDAALLWFQKAADQGYEKATRELPAVSEEAATALMKKAEALKGETLSFKGFYLGMPKKDAWDVFHYYKGRPDYSGLKIQTDDAGNVTRFVFEREALDLIFKTKGVRFESVATQFSNAYKLRLAQGQEEVRVALEFAGVQQHWQSSGKGFRITFYDKATVFNEELLMAAAISNPDIITGHNTWESMVLEKIQVASF